ncbi:MAG: purine-binding chemotaxis protein CheW [Haloarculaceae archaeon]|jgi:purine-binding chemotaxis protein CheW
MTAATTTEMSGQALEFALGDGHYCVGIETIDEIVKPDELTELPETPPQVAGVMDLRGETTTVLDPSLVLEVTTASSDKQIVIFDDEDERIGWLVDRVHSVRDLNDAEIDPVADNRYVDGLISDGDQFTIWVDPETVNGSVST